MNRKIGRVVVVIALTVVVVIAVVGRGSRTYFPVTVAECRIQVRNTVRAPAVEFELVVYESTCGAEQAMSTGVSIAPIGAKFFPDQYPPFFAVRGSASFRVKWLSDKEVEVKTPAAPVVNKVVVTPEGISIIYR